MDSQFKVHFWKEVQYQYVNEDGEFITKYGLVNIYIPNEPVTEESTLLYDCIIVKWTMPNPEVLKTCNYFHIIS